MGSAHSVPAEMRELADRTGCEYRPPRGRSSPARGHLGRALPAFPPAPGALLPHRRAPRQGTRAGRPCRGHVTGGGVQDMSAAGRGGDADMSPGWGGQACHLELLACHRGRCGGMQAYHRGWGGGGDVGMSPGGAGMSARRGGTCSRVTRRDAPPVPHTCEPQQRFAHPRCHCEKLSPRRCCAQEPPAMLAGPVRV